MIRRVYYNFWIDGIKAAQKNSELGEIEWKVLSLLLVSLAMAFNVLTFFTWLVFAGIRIDIFIDFELLPGTMLDSALSFFVTLLWPFLLLNYLLIFRKNRYEQLMEEYPGFDTGGWASVIYFIGSVLLFIVPILVRQWLFL